VPDEQELRKGKTITIRATSGGYELCGRRENPTHIRGNVPPSSLFSKPRMGPLPIC
jgi:hypothetical protein